ncbi:MAG: U32 family peptidase [Clostridia bacterium]|nr:U32 family peptidase [Clostridia bacterium]
MNGRMENLAPAGNPEALGRAIAAGADAVYLGYALFSARAGAGNFDENALCEAIRLAHLYHVRVYVAVNTLIRDEELPAALDVLRLLASLRADAVLVQDLGLAALCREAVPGLAVHASTQMAIHNAPGVRFCAEKGMKRVVLARECSLEEIARCAKEPAEIEVFGHGAQCVAVSGECLFSSMVGGRSGNRGRCAQPCRLLYTYRGEKGAWLSPRDVCLRDFLPQLEEAGAASVKLEGRLKRPEYVAVVAGSYRRGIDGLQQNAFAPADEEEAGGLRQIFHRGGFMRGYAFGAEDADVIDPDRVSHGGVPLGEVLQVKGRLATLRVTKALHDGDQLRLLTFDGDAELIYSGPEIPAGGAALLRLREDVRCAAGDAVMRLTDSRQLEEARALPLPSIPVRMALTAIPGQPLSLEVTDGESRARLTGETVQQAQRRALTEEEAEKPLSMTGGTAFALTGLTLETRDAFVPASELKRLRREALEALAEARIEAFARPESPQLQPEPIVLPEGPAPDALIFRRAEQLKGAPEGLRLIWRPEDYRIEALEKALEETLPEGVWLHLPTVCGSDELEALHAFALRRRDRLGGVVLDSPGQLGLRWELPFGAGMGIPVTNRRTLAFLLGEGCAFVTASPELNARELAVLCEGQPPVLLPAYGRTRLMLLHHCPARTYLGLRSGHAACRLCDEGQPDSLRCHPFLTDRMGERYPLLRQRLSEGCRVELYNLLPTRYPAAVRRLGCGLLTALTDEKDFDHLHEKCTAGHWNRGVE